MNCEKCKGEMQPTGELLGGFPFMACPNCSDVATKAKIKKHKKEIDFADYMSEEELARLEKVISETRVSEFCY